MVVVGNSTMRDIFFRQDVYPIGQTPLPLDHRDRDGRREAHDDEPHTDAAKSLLPIHPKARVYGGPIISGHVGADAAACMLAIDILHETGSSP
jgi:uncharacterized 2Fe-2S/4Fe-4S cluster protein (DUF4445 family)